MGPPFHILAKKGDIAERVIIAGDPYRVKQISGLLDNPVLVNENRGLFVYTGKYKGIPVTVATHGIGSGSAAIVIEELVMLGAKYIVRLGTAGALIPELDIGDYVVASGAACIHNGNSLGQYAPGYCLPTSPSPQLTGLLIEKAKSRNAKFVVGPVFSSDSFYAENPEFAKYWSERGVVAVEMECASLFALSWIRRFHSAALLIISDSLVKDKSVFLTANELKPRVELAATIVLDTLVNVDF